MSIRNLTYFVEVAKEKNFTRAANNLHLSQPALSKVIKNLENDLKVQLIDRQGKQFKLTDAGEIFYNNCETALETINKELEKLYDSVNFQKGKIIVGIPPVIGTAIFPTLLSNFKKTYPDIEIILIEGGAN
ncbi:MAG TPA: LysR family transcriptional regulator, partial [Clostridium sp.]|nr:LysR family transcriptional regulator [Clostridium sp.]